MRTQLFARNTAGETVLLQLTDDYKIKMNLSIATLDPFTPTSYYSQTFRVPGQGGNGKFFEDVYSVNGTTFNAAIAAQAWIMTDGFLFSIGNLNLQAVYTNEKFGTIEYEVFFLGDTSDFIQSVGDSYMDSINTDDLNHDLTYTAVTTSWGATAGSTGGLKNGNVLYPLCEWGYNYDTANFPTNTTLSFGYPKGSTGQRGGSFTNGPTSSLELTQFKPAVRVKWLWDKIFEDAGYTYSSEFIDSDLFDRLYMVSDSQSRTEQGIQAGVCNIFAEAFQLFTGQIARVLYNNAVSNPDGSYSTTASQWRAPATGTFSFRLKGYAAFGNRPAGYPQAAFRFHIYKNGVETFTTPVYLTPDTSLPGSSFPYPVFYDYAFSDSLTADDIIYVEIEAMAYGNSTVVYQNTQFLCEDAPDLVIVRSYFPPEGTVKRMDFIKGISTMFNFVFEPSRVSEKSFTIEPWVDWIQGGTERDWTKYIDGESEIQQIPAFLERERILFFNGTDDQDIQNVNYQDQFKKNYMYREYNSEIKVIKGMKEVSVPFAPTPLQSIPSKTTQYPNWVFPTFGKLQPGDPTTNQSGKVQPIQPKPRILFYNGVQSAPANWYLQQIPLGITGAAQSTYPLVSEFSSFPPNAGTALNLTFRSKPQLWSPASTYTQQIGNDLFTVYWQDYSNWIYDPYTRIYRGKFRLDSYEMQSLKFNDKIWVKDSWYFVREVKDYPVGERAVVEVELIQVPPRVIPLLDVPSPGPYPGTSCRSVAICNNNSILTDPANYTYVDCQGNLQTVTISPQTCIPICALYPLPNALPASWSAIPTGNCVDNLPATGGAPITISVGATGNSFATNAQLVLLGSTGGTGASSFTEVQYYNISGTDSLNLLTYLPYGYYVKVESENRLGPVPVVSQNLTTRVNGSIVGTTGATGTSKTLSLIFPAGLTAGNTYTGITYFTF